jgi:hypothetical protein
MFLKFKSPFNFLLNVFSTKREIAQQKIFFPNKKCSIVCVFFQFWQKEMCEIGFKRCRIQKAPDHFPSTENRNKFVFPLFCN